MINRLLAVALWLSVLPCGALEVRDDEGQLISLANPADRIVALSPHATELIYAAGAGPKLIATVSYSDFPPQARSLPRVGDASRLDRERIVQLNPDLVVGWTSGNQAADLNWLAEQGIPVYKSDPLSLDAIAEAIEEIGTLSGYDDAARQAAHELRNKIDGLGNGNTHEQPVRVFYQLWDQPLMTLNGKHIISRIIQRCGGQNLFADLAPISAEVSREAVIAADPEIIFAPIDEGDKRDPFVQWRQWRQLTAVAEDRLFTIPTDLIHRPTARILEGAKLICERINNALPADTRPSQRKR